jgi:aminopeptidase
VAHGIPFIEVGNGLYPSKYTAQQYGITLDQLRSAYVDGLNAPYATVHTNAIGVQSTIAGGHAVRVTSPSGTNITFGIKPSPIIVSDGVITPAMRARRAAAIYVGLPAGEVIFSPAAGTGNGTIVYDPLYFNNVEVDGLTMRFANGKLAGLTSKTGLADFKKYYDAGNVGKDDLTFADIGVNPGVTFIPASKMSAFMAAGMISLGTGNDLFMGGNNASNFSFASYISNATVAVDGKTVIERGRLVR